MILPLAACKVYTAIGKVLGARTFPSKTLTAHVVQHPFLHILFLLTIGTSTPASSVAKKMYRSTGTSTEATVSPVLFTYVTCDKNKKDVGKGSRDN